MHIAFYAISTMAGLTREAGWKLLCAKARNRFLLLPSAVCLSILHCTVVISHKFGALITSSKPWLLEAHFLPGMRQTLKQN